jgi:hypothetical protein
MRLLSMFADLEKVQDFSILWIFRKVLRKNIDNLAGLVYTVLALLGLGQSCPLVPRQG